MGKRLIRRNLKILNLFLVLIVAVSFLSCKNETANKCENATKGTLKNMTGLDGCGWIIQLSDGTKLEPINLEDFDVELIENKSVCFRYHEKEEYGSYCMAGTVIEIDFIE